MVKSVYIHIPFCKNICSYCDFPKMIKKDVWVDQYLIELEKEIKLYYKNEKIETLYIGGGSPSCLNVKQLEKLFEILKVFNTSEKCEITLEANSEDLTKEKLKYLKNKINRLSIGIQTFDKDLLTLFNRKVNIQNLKEAKKVFNNINIDLMYDFNDKFETLKHDLDNIIKLNPEHISTYALILEKNTELHIKNYKKNESEFLEPYINKVLEKNSYIHYEISNYAKKGFQSKHNLTYWNNEEYYGFGLGASGYINNKRYDNTRSLTQYLKGKYLRDSHIVDENEKLQNEFILGFRKIGGINKIRFKQKYQFDMSNIYLIKELLRDGYLQEEKNNILINPKYIYTQNEILMKFLIPHLHKQ